MSNIHGRGDQRFLSDDYMYDKQHLNVHTGKKRANSVVALYPTLYAPVLTVHPQPMYASIATQLALLLPVTLIVMKGVALRTPQKSEPWTPGCSTLARTQQ